ncbi:MAG: putative sulfate exporter family transporter [Pseudomonadota bacterium]
MADHNRDLPQVADLYGELQLAEPEQKTTVTGHLPGLALVGVIAMAALWLSEHYGPPAILMGLLIGLALNFASADRRLSAGLDFASQTLLRAGIVLIGMRITFGEISSLGITPFVALVCIMGIVMITGMLASRLFRQDMMFGLLAGGATAICGASAALALWSIIGKERIGQSRFTIVLLGTTIASAAAMTFYPAIAAMLELDDTQAGFLIGASIHDVAQAIGGGFSYSSQAGEVATVVKLSRVTLLAPILIIVAVMLQKFGSNDAGPEAKVGLRQGLPWFIIGFILLVALNSTVSLPEPVVAIGNQSASILLLFAVIAAAIKSNLAGLLSHGWTSFGPILVTTLMSFGLALLAVQFI